MPISDEVIELVPAGKSKSKLIIFIVAAAVGLALAATFLILFLLKPNVEERPQIVNDVTISSTDLFTTTDGDDNKQVTYVSVGQQYTVSADVSVENGANTDIIWDVQPRGAVTEVAQSGLGKAVPASNPTFTFMPNYEFAGTEVSLTAYSQHDRQKYTTVKFTILAQRAEGILLKEYNIYQGNTKATAINQNTKTITVPFYDDVTKNKMYIVDFEQLGKLDQSTGKYLPVSDITLSDGKKLNAVGVSTDYKNIVTADVISTTRVRFNPKKTGEANVIIKANVNNNPDTPSPVTETVHIVVKSAEEMGYVEDIIVFNKPIVTEEFIESILDDTHNKIVTNRLTEKLKEMNKDENGVEYAASDPRRITYNSEITLPYNTSSYNDIYSHVLVTPIALQYDWKAKDGEKIKKLWYDGVLSIETSNPNNRSVYPSTDPNTKIVSLSTTALTSNVKGDGVNAIKLIFKAVEGVNDVSRAIDMNVVAKNSEGTVTTQVGSDKYEGNTVVEVVPSSTATLSVTYKKIVMGKVEEANLTNLIDYNYMSKYVYLEFDKDCVSIVRNGSDTQLEPNVIYPLQADAIKFGKESGSGNAISRDGTVTFTVSVKPGLSDGKTFSITYHKIGSFHADDASWSRTVNFKVNKIATDAWIDEDKALEVATINGETAGGIKLVSDTSANLYVQNRNRDNTPFVDLYDIVKMFDANGAFDAAITKFETYGGSNGVLVRQTTTNSPIIFGGNKHSAATTTEYDGMITVAITSGGKPVKEFTIYVYAIDAITQFVDFEVDSKTYNGSSYSTTSIAIPTDKIKVRRVFSGVDELYTGALTVALSYKQNGIDVMFERNAANGTITFGYKVSETETIPVYMYENNKLTPVRDLYAFGREHGNIQFNDVKLYLRLPENEYSMASSSDSVVKDENGKPCGVVFCSFYREADDVVIATSANFAKESILPLTEDKDGETVVKQYFYNQGSPVELFVSSVIKISKSESVIAAQNAGYIGHLPAYIALDTSVYTNTSGDEYKDATPAAGIKYYTHVRFTMPKVVVGKNEQERSLSLYYGMGTSPQKFADDFNFTVQNLSRPISNIKLFSDAACSKPITEADMEFGNYIGKNAKYSITVYVQLTYAAYNSNHMLLETAELELPKFLTAKVGTLEGRYITLDPKGKIDVNAENAQYTFTCEISLAETAMNGSALVIVRQTSATEGGVRATVNAVADTGLSGITLVESGENGAEYVSDASNAVDVVVNINLSKDNINNPGTAQSFKFTVNYNALIDSKYTGIKYDITDKIGVDYSESANTISGITFVNNLLVANGVSEIKIDPTAIKTVSDTYVIKITDLTGGASTGNVFTINIQINVTVDIYELEFDMTGEAATDKYTVETKNSSVDPTKPIVIKYNDGDGDLQPDYLTKKKVDVYIVQDGKRYTGEDFNLTTTENDTAKTVTYTLTIKDSVLEAKNVAVRMAYGGIVKDMPVFVKSLAHYIDFANDAIDHNKISDGVYGAQVVVKNAVGGNTFPLGMVVRNLGTKEIVADKAGDITFGVYTDADCKNAADGIASYADGAVIITPAAAKGVVYFRASYDDEDGTGKTYTLTVAITYYVEITGVTIDVGSIADAMNGNTIMLYYYEGAYSQIDLAGHINATNDFNKEFGSELEIVITAAQANIEIVDGTVIMPKSVAANDIALTVTAKYKGENVPADPIVNKTYSVSVSGLNAPTLTKPDNCSVDIAALTTVDVTVSYTRNDKLNGSFVFATPVTGITFTPGNNGKYTFAADRSVAVGTYTITGTLYYTLNGTSATIFSDAKYNNNNAFAVPVSFTLNVTCSQFTPEFKLVATQNGTDVDINPDQAFMVTSGTTYKLVITSTTSDSGVTYSASEEKNVLHFGTRDGNDIPFTLDDKMSGDATVTLTATILGVEFNKTVSYTFSYGLNVTSTLQIYDMVNDEGVEFTGSSYYIDYTVNKVIFRLKLNNFEPSNATLNLTVSGGTRVAGYGVAGNTTADYVDIEVDTVGTLIIGGYVEVGGRTVYLHTYVVELLAHAPEFKLVSAVNGTDKSELNPGEEVTLSYENLVSYFKGDIGTVVYSFVSGSAHATFKSGSTNVIVVNKNIETDCFIVLKATISVTNGVYAGKQFVVTKELTIKGKSKPVISWNDGASYEMERGSNKKFVYNVVGGISVGDYTVAVGVVTDNNATTLTSGTDFTYDQSTGILSVIASDNTKAGGRITLRATLNVTGLAHNGYEVSEDIVIIVKPIIETKPVTIGNAKGTIDLADNIVVNVGSGDSFISDSDTVIKSLAFKQGETYDNLFAINGSNLTLKNNVEIGRAYTFDVEVAVVNGAYAGTIMHADIAVTVASQPSIAAINTSWNSAKGAEGYNTISVTTDSVSESSGLEVTDVTVRATGVNAKWVNIVNNVISVDKNANTYFTGTTKDALPIDLEYEITAGGHKYVAIGSLSIPEVAISVTAVDENGNNPQSGLTKYVNDTFEVTFTATNGFDVVITSIEFKKPSESAEDMMYSFGGNKALFTTPATAASDNYNITINYTVGGLTSSITPSISVQAATATTVFTAQNTDATDMVVGKPNTVISEWNFNDNSNSQYYYGVSVSITVPQGILSKYFKSVKLYMQDPDDHGSYTSASLIGSTATMEFGKTSAGGWGNYYYYNSVKQFWIVLEYNTEEAISKCPITVSLRAANQSYSRNSKTQDITMTYSVQVTDVYTVTFIPNAPTASVTDVTMTVSNGSTYGILPTAYRNLYTFKGWYTQAIGGTQITKDTIVELTDDIQLYAQWTAKQNIITLVTNGGTVAGQATVKAGENYSVPTTATRTGYMFAGWYTEPTGGTQITNSTKAGEDSVYTVLYARWDPINVTINLDAAEGNVSNTSMTRKYGAEYGVMPTPTRTGYTFGGWFTGENGTGSRIYSNTVMNSATAVTLHAYWIENTYTVTLNLNYDGASDYLTFNSIKGAFAMHSMITPTRDEYVFIGWFNEASGGAKVDDSFSVNADTILYAHWQKVQYTVIFDVNDGEGSVPSKQYSVGDTYGTLPTVSRTGYVFEGWSKTKDGEAVDPNDAFDKTALTLYAVWTLDTEEVEENA